MANTSWQYNKTEWNINQLFSEILKDLIIEQTRYAQVGDVRGWFNTCRNIYRKIYGHPKVRDTSMTTIDMLMKKAKLRLNQLPTNITDPLNQMQQHAFSRATMLLDEIDLRLMNELYHAGLIFPLSNKESKNAGLEIQ